MRSNSAHLLAVAACEVVPSCAAAVDSLCKALRRSFHVTPEGATIPNMIQTFIPQ